MFVKNDPEGRFVNGSLGVVRSLGYSIVEIELENGDIVKAEPVKWEYKDEDGKVKAYIEQIPLRLAWAITIHKSQGMSLGKAQMDLSKTFVKGQGYVALSRVRNIKGLKLLGINDKALEVDEIAKEYDMIFKESSENTEKIFQAFSEEKKRKMQEEFLLNASSLKHKQEEKEKSSQKTLKILQSLHSIERTAKERGLSVDTIVRHIEQEQSALSLDELYKVREFKELQDSSATEQIFASFDKCGTDKLSPVYDDLSGKYSYLDIKLARILYKMQNLI